MFTSTGNLSYFNLQHNLFIQEPAVDAEPDVVSVKVEDISESCAGESNENRNDCQPGGNLDLHVKLKVEDGLMLQG
jgi:hypothetical protein